MWRECIVRAALMVRAAQSMVVILVSLSTTALWKAVSYNAAARVNIYRTPQLRRESTPPPLRRRPVRPNSAPPTAFLTPHQQTLLGMPIAHRKLRRMVGVCSSPEQRPIWNASPTELFASTSRRLLAPLRPSVQEGRGPGRGSPGQFRSSTT